MSSTASQRDLVPARAMGTDVPRVDGELKVTGQAEYAYEHTSTDVLYAHLVQSTVARGRIRSIDAGAALALPEIVTVVDHTNAPRLADRSDREFDVLQDAVVDFRGQIVAIVLANTPEAARYAATLVGVTYREKKAAVEFTEKAATHKPDVVNPSFPTDTGSRRAVAKALKKSEVVVEGDYETSFEHNNPMEPHSYVATWTDAASSSADSAAGERTPVLTMYDSTQSVHGVAQTLAPLFGLEPDQVRVLCPYVGGGFGSKGLPHAPDVAAALAARVMPGRAVKLAVTRQQMFALCGYRTATLSRMRLGADADGRLGAVDHQVFEPTSASKIFAEQTAVPTRSLYAAGRKHTSHRLARLDIDVPSWMRAPGVFPGVFAHEVAMDELAVATGVDPVELRVRNEPEIGDDTGLPFADRRLVECLREGARRFGWRPRTGEPGTRIDGEWRIGYGVAASTYPAESMPGNVAKIRAAEDGRLQVSIGAADLGTGTWTTLTLVAADALGVDPDGIDLRIGDSDLPSASVAGGSAGTSSWSMAIVEAARTFREEHGQHPAPGAESVADGVDSPSDPDYAHHSFGAQFAELAVHRLTGELRVRRMVGVFSAGRIVNPRAARSQFIGGMTMGISAALHEESFRDPRFGHIVTQDLASYHVAAHADVVDIDVTWLDGDDPTMNAIGARGIGEIGIVGAPAAVLNAAFDATGVRVRRIPITADLFL